MKKKIELIIDNLILKEIKLNEKVDDIFINYIKAYTSKGGELYSKYKMYDIISNENHTISILKTLPKVKNDFVYRKIDVTEQEWQKMFDSGYVEKNNIIKLSDKLQSCTFSKSRAFTYSGNKPKSILYKIKTFGKNIVDISDYSIYPEEEECLILPNTKFKVLDWDYTGHIRIDCEEI